jgi:hypothetical protein
MAAGSHWGERRGLTKRREANKPPMSAAIVPCRLHMTDLRDHTHDTLGDLVFGCPLGAEGASGGNRFRFRVELLSVSGPGETDTEGRTIQC